ncbi:MAG: hypothetical protein AAGE93_08640 [Bacteroidota bacterium]
MKKIIVMLLAWAAICLLSVPRTTENISASNEEETSSTSSLSLAEVKAELFSKLP